MIYNVKEVLDWAFHFWYAGIIDLSIKVNKKSFSVCGSGFQLIDNIVLFNPYGKYINNYETLYQAIEEYNSLINIIISNKDWYKPLGHKDSVFNKENFIKLYNKRIYDNVH